MDPVRNPFTPGAGVEPAHLLGRNQQIQAFEVLLQRLTQGRTARSPILYGLRGVGKTVLLSHEFNVLAGRRSWQTVEFEARPGLHFEHALARGLHRALLRLSAGQKGKDLISRAWGVLRAFELRWNPDGTLAAGMTVEAEHGRADTGDRETDVAELLLAVTEAAEAAGSGIVVLIDEMHLLERDVLEAVVAGMHEVSKRRLPLAVAGAGLPQLPRLLAEAKTYAERIFDYQHIGNLDHASAQELLQHTAEDGLAAGFSRDALDCILDLSQCYPYFLQVYGHETWNVAAGPDWIELDDVQRALPLIREQLDTGFFHVRWERATPRERQYLQAMAHGGDGPQSSSEVAARLNTRPSKVSVPRDRLIQKGLIYAPDHGLVDFTAPMFAEYVRRVHPG